MNHKPNWNFYSLCILILFGFFSILEWPFSPKFLDMYYHLFVMKGFNEAGGYVTSSFWEYAPIGRPHLYPPLLHMLMLALYKTGLSEITVARLVEAALYPALLFSIWRTAKRLFSERTAFFTLLIASSSYSFYVMSVTLPAFTLALILGLWVFPAIEEKKVLAASLLLGFSLYSHAWMGLLIGASLALYGLLNRKTLKDCLLVAGGGILLASPYFLHLFRHLPFFEAVKVKERRLLEWDLLVYAAALIGTGIALRRKGGRLYPLCLAAVMLPFAAIHSLRFLSGQGMTGIFFLGGIAMDWGYGKFAKEDWNLRGVFFLFLAFLFFCLAAPVVHTDAKTNRTQIKFFDRSLAHYLLPEEWRTARPREHSVYFEKSYDEILKIVEKHTAPRDILWSDFPHGAALIALLSNRVTSSATMPEVKPYRSFDEIKAARLLIWFKNPDGSIPEGMKETAGRYRLQPIGETDLAYLYLNPETN